MQTRMIITAAVTLLASLALTGCMSDEQPERTDDAVVPTSSTQPPAAGPTASAPPVDPPSNPDVPQNFCQATEAWCPTPYIWPLDEWTAQYLGISQQCYCWCDMNKPNPHPSCANSPQPSECGAIYDVVVVDGVPTKKVRFPGGQPFVCRISEYQQAL